MRTWAPDQTVGRHPETASRLIDGEAVILRPLDNRILNLNETGSRIWELLSDRPTVAGIVDTIASEFEVGADEATKDVKAFLDELLERDLLDIT